MNNKILILSIMSIAAMVFLAGCTKAVAPGTTAPTVSSGNVESSSSAAQSTADTFVNDATPTSDQVVPDLT